MRRKNLRSIGPFPKTAKKAGPQVTANVAPAAGLFGSRGAHLNILVTGGAGFIGSHTCKALAKAGYTPVSYDNLSRGHREAVKWGPLEIGDIVDHDRVRSVLKQYRPIAVMHFSAYAYVGESVQKPLLYYRNNIGGSASLLQAVIDCGPLPFVFSSSCATYGHPEEIPITEDHPQRPINPYGFSKFAVERMLGDIGTAIDCPGWRYAISTLQVLILKMKLVRCTIRKPI